MGLLALVAVVNRNWRGALLWLFVAVVIDTVDGSAVGCEKDRGLLEGPLDRVAVGTVGKSRDGHESSPREIRLNQVGARFGRGSQAAKRKSHRLGQRGLSTASRPDDTS